MTRRPDLYFFLSYAQGSDRDNALVLRFFNELREEVRLTAGLRRGQEPRIGFIDVSLTVGVDWSVDITRAVDTCQVFLALCCPTYFASSACTEEWDRFHHRLVTHRNRTGVMVPALIPLIWQPMDLPEKATRLQYRQLSLGATYAKIGLRQLIGLQRNDDDYREFLPALATTIVATVEAHHIEAYGDEPSDAPPKRIPHPRKSEPLKKFPRIENN